MTDKTPKNTAETAVNTSAALAKTTDTVREGELKSRALPQTDALKARFKAGSIPLQTDFADLIDIANMGRQAVGDEFTGFGLVKDSKNRLRLDPLKLGNLTYDLSPSKNDEWIVLDEILAGEVKDHNRIAFLALREAIGPDIATATAVGDSTTYTVNAFKIDAAGKRSYTKVKIIARKAVGMGSKFVPFEYVNEKNSQYSLWYTFRLDTTDDDFSNCMLVIEPLTLFVKKITDFSTTPLDGEIISFITFNFVYHGIIVGDGLQVDNFKIAAKIDANKGLQVNNSGISIQTGNGIAINSSGVNVKLAKGANTNGGEGHGTDGATSGSGGGLNLTANGLSVDPGNGIQINQQGVSIKLAANSGLSADETNGLKVVPEQQFQKGMIMMFSGKEAPKGWTLCDGSSGTPNLLDRFILGGKFGDINQKNNTTLSGNSNDKKFSITTDKSKADIDVKVESHKLTINEMPKHSHGGVDSVTWVSGGGNMSDGSNNKIGTKSTGESGGGQAHNHGSTVTQTSHSHNASIMPPYYVLAFIMKL